MLHLNFILELSQEKSFDDFCINLNKIFIVKDKKIVKTIKINFKSLIKLFFDVTKISFINQEREKCKFKATHTQYEMKERYTYISISLFLCG